MRVVQLTDLHLVAKAGGRVRGVDVGAAFDRALQAAREGSPDFFVLSGDLSQDKTLASYQSLRARMGDALERTLVLPGNHDHAAHLAECFPGSRGAPGRVGFSVKRDGWQLLGVDSKAPRRVSGRVGADQLAWLEAELSAGSEPALLFLHHPPIATRTWWLDPALKDAPALAALLTRHPRVRAVSCGHVHMPAQVRLGAVQVYTSPATCFQFVPGSLWPGSMKVGSAFRRFELGAEFSTELVEVA